MARVSETAIAGGRRGRAAGSLWGKLAAKFAFLFELFKQAFETEAALRRPFLWLPVSAGAGVVLYLYADREPSLWLIASAAATFGVLAYFAQANRLAFFLLCGLCALFAGELSAALRTVRVAAPVIDRVHIATLDGFIEEMDFRRRTGARFLLRVHSATGLAPGETPVRVRLSTRRAPPFEAGTFVRLKARLLPPAHACLPCGYDFARDAWFAQLGAVGNVLGRIEVVEAPVSPGLGPTVMMAIRGRSRPPWSPASAICCPVKPRTSSARPGFFISSPSPAFR